MPTLAPKLPYTHPFAGGYPRLGGQPLPTDPDAIDYLNRVAAADGAAVEVGVAVAVDDFFRDTKAAGVFDAIKASCILCGARTLAGALVPVVGDAPTNVANGFVSGDYTRGGATPGLKGDGTSFLNSGRANDDDPQNDKHLAVYVSSVAASAASYRWIIGDDGTSVIGQGPDDKWYGRANDTDTTFPGAASPETGLIGVSRGSSASKDFWLDGTNYPIAAASSSPSAANTLLFRRNEGSIPGYSTATLAFYSIGTSLSLEDLDTAVSNLINAIGEAL